MLALPISLIRDKNVTDRELFAYVFTKILTYSSNYNGCLFNLTEVCDQAYGEINSHSSYDRVAVGFKGLVDKNYLKVKKINKSSWFIFMDSFDLADERFILVEPEDLRTLVDKIKSNKASVLRFYLLLVTTISAKTKVGTYQREWFAKAAGMSKSTVSGYFKRLEEIELISVYRTSDFYNSNTYGLYKDKQIVQEVGAKRGSEVNFDKRKYTAMYLNAINGYPYDKATLEDIRDHMIKREIERENVNGKRRGEDYDLAPLIAKINAM